MKTTKLIKCSEVVAGMRTSCGMKIDKVQRSGAFRMDPGNVAAILVYHKNGFEICHPEDKLEVQWKI